MPRVSSKTIHVQKRATNSASTRAESREAPATPNVIHEHKLLCVLCSEAFNTTYHLSCHIEESHSGQTSIRFQCGFEHCEQVFFSPAECDEHYGIHCLPNTRYCETYVPLGLIQEYRTATGVEIKVPTLLSKCPFHNPGKHSACVTNHKKAKHATYGSFVCTGQRAKKAKQEGWLAQARANTQPKGRRRPKQVIRAPSEESTLSSHSTSSSSSASSAVSSASFTSWASTSSSSSSTSPPSSPASASSFFCSPSPSQSSQSSVASSPTHTSFNTPSPTSTDSFLPEYIPSGTAGVLQGYAESTGASSSCVVNDTVLSYDWVTPVETTSPVRTSAMSQTSIPRVFGWSADSQSTSSSQPIQYSHQFITDLLNLLDPLDPSDPYPSAAYVRKEPRT